MYPGINLNLMFKRRGKIHLHLNDPNPVSDYEDFVHETPRQVQRGRL